MRRISLAKLTYGQLALVPLLAAALVWQMSAKYDVYHGWGRLWFITGGALVALAAVQAVRKWICERS